MAERRRPVGHDVPEDAPVFVITDGVNLAGIKRIIELETQVDALRAKVAELATELDHAHAELAARSTPSTALVVWQPAPRRR